MCGSTGRCTQIAVGSPLASVAARILRARFPTPFGIVLAFLLAQQAVRLDGSSRRCAYGSNVEVQRVAVELTSLVTPYAANIGTSILAWRRPRELMGRVESFRDQSLRSIALACRRMISGVVGG